MRRFRTGKEAMCTSRFGRVVASRAMAKIVFAWPISEFVTNRTFLVRTVVSLFVASIEIWLSVLRCRVGGGEGLRQSLYKSFNYGSTLDPGTSLFGEALHCMWFHPRG